jgi:Hormone receptor domain
MLIAMTARISMFWLQQSATYACHVQSGAGSSTARVEVTVTSPEVIPLCRGESLLGVQWPHTAPGQVAMQSCPTQQRFSNRAARRMCTLYDFGVARWQTPDFSECVSAKFDSIQRKVSSSSLFF